MIWLIVAGDLTPLGGMDAANLALARYLASRDEIHLVTHRVDGFPAEFWTATRQVDEIAGV